MEEKRLNNGKRLVKVKNMVRVKNPAKGSITVEAALVFPFFLCIAAVLMFLIRTAAVASALDHATYETVRQLSGHSYILALLNDLEDEKAADAGMDYNDILKDELGNLGQNSSSAVVEALRDIVSGKSGTDALGRLWQTLADEIGNRFDSSLGRILAKTTGARYTAIKNELKNEVVLGLVRNNLRDNGRLVDAERISLIYCELPQSMVEYVTKSEDPHYLNLWEEIGYTPEKDDTVLVIKYENRLALPFFGNVKFTTVHRSVEKGWVAGSRGAGEEYYDAGKNTGTETSAGNSVENIGGDDISDKSLVYVTKTGTKYHDGECLYLEKSKIPLKLSEAIERGYSPCKVCILKTAEPIKRKQ